MKLADEIVTVLNSAMRAAELPEIFTGDMYDGAFALALAMLVLDGRGGNILKTEWVAARDQYLKDTPSP